MSKRDKARQLLSDHGMLRAREFEEHGISHSYIAKLADDGDLQRLARGVYATADHKATEHHDLAIIQKRIPHAVFCLRTALRFHELTTALPNRVHIAVERTKGEPTLEWPPLEVFHISESQFVAGIETHKLREGPTIRMYSPARTVADCFKFRNRLGLDLALEALEDCLSQDRCTVDELLEFADVCRVKNVIRPYIEAKL